MKLKFSYAKETDTNPYMGFNTFQHFKGEKLYSDIIVDPKNNMTETEHIECYPIPSYVEQNGRGQGFHPDGNVAYIRILWKDFEPEFEKYNFGFVDEILSDAESHGQTVMFRLMAHSTREEDDVPDWLKKIIPCPERPCGMRVKDSPTDPRFLQFFAKAIRALGERYDSNPTLDIVDLSLPGAWGEGHKVELFPIEDIKALMDAYIEAFPNTMFISQVIIPELVSYINSKHKVGWRADGIGRQNLTYEYYPNLFAKIPEHDELWKKAPIAFESYWWLGEWERQHWDFDGIFKALLDWHVTYFNAKSLPIPYESKEKIDSFISKMGYHFQLSEVDIPDVISGEEIKINYVIKNSGVAPIYHNVKTNWKLKGENGECFEFVTNNDIRDWMPGECFVTDVLTLPGSMAKGKYTLSFGIGDDTTPLVYLCNDLERNGKFYDVCSICIE